MTVTNSLFVLVLHLLSYIMFSTKHSCFAGNCRIFSEAIISITEARFRTAFQSDRSFRYRGNNNVS